jgi:hypothetical protein
LIFSTYSFANKIEFDEPQSQNKVSLGKSQDSDGQVEFECWNYKSYAIAQVNDPAIKGAKEIILRFNKTKSDICAPDFSGKEINLSDLSGEYYFQGAKGKYLFFESADSFGDQLAFQIRFSESGKKILSSTRNDGKSFLMVSQKNNNVSLSYHQALKVSCSLAKEGHSCWQRILKENRVPSSLKLSAPDCKNSFEKGKSALDNQALVSAPVMIHNLSKPKIVFTAGTATCDPAP